MPNLTPYINNILAGETIRSQARLAGVDSAEMRRELLAHPGYAEAKASGLLDHKGGRPNTLNNVPRTVEDLRAHPAVVAVVVGGMTQAAAAKLYNLRDQVQLSQWVRKAYPDRVKPGGGRGRPAGSANKAHNNTSPAPDHKGLLPVISWVQAGNWVESCETMDEPEVWLPCPTGHSANSFILRVDGDSMQSSYGRSYPPGCMIYVDPERNSPTNGERIVARLEGSNLTTFKVFKDEDAARWLMPLNHQHPNLYEKFHIIGTVIGKWEEG